MKNMTISVICAGSVGWIGTVTDAKGNQIYRTGKYHPTAIEAFKAALKWAEKETAT